MFSAREARDRQVGGPAVTLRCGTQEWSRPYLLGPPRFQTQQWRTVWNVLTPAPLQAPTKPASTFWPQGSLGISSSACQLSCRLDMQGQHPGSSPHPLVCQSCWRKPQPLVPEKTALKGTICRADGQTPPPLCSASFLVSLPTPSLHSQQSPPR